MTDLAIALHTPVPAELVVLGDYRRRAEVETLIARCRTSFGAPLSAIAKSLVRAACIHPDDAAWDEAHGVIVTPNVTLWEAVLAHTDYDVWMSPRFVAQLLPSGTIRTTRAEWSAIPTGDQVVAALRAIHLASEGRS